MSMSNGNDVSPIRRVESLCRQHPMTEAGFFSEAVVRTHLNGRLLPPEMLCAMVQLAQRRFNEGKVPVLDAWMRASIDRHAFARDPCASEIAAPNEKLLAAFEQLAAMARQPACRGQAM